MTRFLSDEQAVRRLIILRAVERRKRLRRRFHASRLWRSLV